MPLLPAEPDLYPPDLFDRPAPDPVPEPDAAPGDEDEAARWWCLHTKPRQEKAAARFLRERRLAHYLPQVFKESRTPGGRKTRSVIPLFPGYLFLLSDSRQRIESFQGGQLVAVLAVDDQGRIQVELAQIHRMLSSGLPVAPEPTYPVGSRVRILSGPLEGLVGIVTQRGNRDHFVVAVHFLGRGAAVELEGWRIELARD
ncbi:transcription termination/antitermination protein NusG [Tautonia plasticadhaerens]|nr:transcription termination/antitermination NusG family protein [Tautonia plasticadhaerens]